MYASENGQIEVVKYLVEKGADLTIESYNSYYTALMLASQNEHNDIVKYLESKGDTE